jgi:hypothetical protein
MCIPTNFVLTVFHNSKIKRRTTVQIYSMLYATNLQGSNINIILKFVGLLNIVNVFVNHVYNHVNNMNSYGVQ